MDTTHANNRYLISFEAHRLPHIFADVLVIGGGAAGMRAAIESAKYGKTLLLAKELPAQSNSAHAQGGIAAVLDAADSHDAHLADTLAAGAEMCDEQVVRHVVSAGPEHIQELLDWGAQFDRSDGELDLTREGGHGHRRIAHAHGDATGREIVRTLLEKAHSTENLKFFENCFVIDLLTDPPEGGPEGRCLGAITWHQRYGLQMIWARQTILASGGAGRLWRETTNPPPATADGHAMAYRAGVTMADMEMMQFHPTILYIAGASRSLISEAVRGEGAYLVDKTGSRFMPDLHPSAELAPRDFVSRAILTQMRKTDTTHVALDVRHIGREKFAQRFPGIYEECTKFDIDPGSDLIPVRPAAHYMIGGLHVDLDGRTSMEGLLACGESACTGLHGANRLGSNSLIEALVFGHRCGEVAGEALGETDNDRHVTDLANFNQSVRRTELDLADIRNSLRAVMWRNAGVARQGQQLEEVIEIVNFWSRYVLDKDFATPAGWEVQNMLTVARLVATCALRRTETRGVHHREDYPDATPSWRRHQLIRRGD